MIIADLKRFTHKNKLVIYIGVFIEVYNLKNGGQVHKINKIIEREKMRVLTAENPCNLGSHEIIQILSILYSANVIPRD